MKYKLTFALVAALTSTAFAAFQAPLPEFKNEKQLADWRAEKASEATSQGYAAEDTAFYTGKPYLASSGGYAFKYRSYNPEMARWTSEDPSGFPDGANANAFLSNSPLQSIDPDGLRRVELWDQETFENPFGSTIGGHYLKVWGITTDNKKFTSYGYDSQEGTYTFNVLPGSYDLNVHDPVLITDSAGVDHLTITSEWRAYVGIEIGGLHLSITQGNSTLDVTIHANE